MLRLQHQRLAVGLHGVFIALQVAECITPITPGIHKIWLQSDRLLKTGCSFSMRPQLSQCITQVVARCGIVRVRIYDLPQQFHTLLLPTCLGQQHAEHLQGGQMCRVQRQHSTVPCLSCIELATLVLYHSKA